MLPEARRVIARARWRLQTQGLLNAVTTPLASAWAAALVLVVMAALTPKFLFFIPLLDGLMRWGWLVALGAVLLWTYWRFRPISDVAAALALDRAFSLHERLSTLVALENRAAPELVAALERAVAHHLPLIRPEQALPWRWSHRYWLPLVPLVALLGLALFLPARVVPTSPLASEPLPAADEARVGEAANRLAESARQRRQQAEAALLDPRLADLAGKVENIAGQLQEETRSDVDNNLSAEQAALRLNDVTKELEQFQSQRALSAQLGQTLAQWQPQPSERTRELTRALQQNQYAEAARRTEQLQQQARSAPPDERDALQRDLTSLRQQLGELGELSQNRELQKQLQQLAEQFGDFTKPPPEQKNVSPEAMPQSNPAATLAQWDREARTQRMTDQLLDDLAEARNDILQSSSPSSAPAAGGPEAGNDSSGIQNPTLVNDQNQAPKNNPREENGDTKRSPDNQMANTAESAPTPPAPAPTPSPANAKGTTRNNIARIQKKRPGGDLPTEPPYTSQDNSKNRDGAERKKDDSGSTTVAAPATNNAARPGAGAPRPGEKTASRSPEHQKTSAARTPDSGFAAEPTRLPRGKAEAPASLTVQGKGEQSAPRGASVLEARERAVLAAPLVERAITRQNAPAQVRQHTREYFENLARRPKVAPVQENKNDDF